MIFETASAYNKGESDNQGPWQKHESVHHKSRCARPVESKWGCQW
jgi:hypothetical protein